MTRYECPECGSLLGWSALLRCYRCLCGYTVEGDPPEIPDRIECPVEVEQ